MNTVTRAQGRHAHAVTTTTTRVRATNVHDEGHNNHDDHGHHATTTTRARVEGDNHDDDHVLRPLRAPFLLPTQHDAIMDDLVSSKGEPSPSAVTGTTASATSMTFQATQTVQEHDVCIQQIYAPVCVP